MEFNKTRCINNITYLAKSKGIKIGDIESVAGVSAGYLARINKEESKASPSIELLVNVANRLEVSLDTLITIDCSSISPAEQYVIGFLTKLIENTESGEEHWWLEAGKTMEACGVNIDSGFAQHPLFRNRSDDSNEVEYNSLFHLEESVEHCYDAFRLVFFGRALYITKIDFCYGSSEGTKTEFEFYSVKNHKVEPICSSANKTFETILSNLYHVAEKSSKEPSVSKDLRSDIDSYLIELPF